MKHDTVSITICYEQPVKCNFVLSQFPSEERDNFVFAFVRHKNLVCTSQDFFSECY